MDLNITVSPVYHLTARSTARIIVNRGGTRSSKTFSTLQLFMVRFFSERNKRMLITRRTMPALRLSAMDDMIRMMKDAGVYDLVKHTKSPTNTLTYEPNGNEMVFAPLDDPQKFRGPGWNYVFMNEANENTWEDFNQLNLRLSRETVPGQPNQIFVDFNPDDPEVWIKTELEDTRLAHVIVSNYTHNPFLSYETIETIERLRRSDPDFWEIFGLGQYGTRNKALIYGTWQIAPGDSWPEQLDDECYGLDFGYSSSPTALVHVGKLGDDLWEEQLLYRTGLTNSDLIRALKDLVPDRTVPIYADHAEPQRIEELYRAGFNVHPAEKAVRPGIEFCQRFHTNILASSGDLLNEIKLYKWRQDRTGKALEEPVKFRDHLMDARRYAIFTHGRQYWATEDSPFHILDLDLKTQRRKSHEALFRGY
jgi:phage terminase large subunit